MVWFMRNRLSIRRVLFEFFLLVLYALPICAQVPRRLQNCSGRPISPYVLTPTRDDKPHPTASIEDVTFQGASNLPETIQAQIIERVKQTHYYPDANGIRAFEEIVREEWQKNGYFQVQVTVEPHFMNSDPKIARISITFRIDEGQQYCLKEIRFDNAKVFPVDQLRSQFQLHDGDIFDLVKIRHGLEALTRLYGRHGYINFTATPDLHVDNAQRRISAFFELDLGKQFRVGSVEILGLDPKIVISVLKTKFKEGDVFDFKLVDEFFIDNKSVLPIDASYVDDLWIKQDPANSTVAIVLDFRACPRDSM